MGRAIPTQTAPYSDQDAALNQQAEHPMSAPIQTGVASLWAKAQNIHNPVLRVLGEIGAGGARALDTAASIAAPKIAKQIPGTTQNAIAQEQAGEQEQGNQAKIAQEQAATEETKARVPLTQAQVETEQEKPALERAETEKDLRPPEVKQGQTPEETTIHDLMTGENGQPRINPQTQQPYSYLDAYQAVNQAKQDTKPVAPTKPDNPEQQFIDEFQRTHPSGTVAQAVSAYAAATQKPDRDQGSKVDARADKSYTYNNNKLDQLATPIEQAVGRLGRLRDTLAQGTPQADALVAPELLTVMAGGAGSGLRMNEAEISRIVGGRSKWESLQAAVNQWRLDPTKANSITPEQRQEIHQLMDVVTNKLTAKQQALDGAREKLLDSDDPKEHRRIVTDAHHSLTQVDEGQGGGEPTRPANVPQGYIYQENGPKGKGWYKPKAQ
jgi:hypothetical protein